MRLEVIEKIINEIPFVNSLKDIRQEEFNILGSVEILFDGLEESLNFDFIVTKEYPLKTFDSESIKFINTDLLQYNHVMKDGFICIHTSHSNSLEHKLKIDFSSLKSWIEKYYINKDKDEKYEHIIVDNSSIDGIKYSFLFSDTNHSFKRGEFGFVNTAYLDYGIHLEDKIVSFIVKEFQNCKTIEVNECNWSEFYSKSDITLQGAYYFCEDSPSTFNKFIFDSWDKFEFNSEFLNFLYELKNKLKPENHKIFPLFIGYRINDTQIHWQVAILELGNFPLKGEPIKIDGKKTGRWQTVLIDEKISWALSRNASYQYFFGRGKFCDDLTDKKILIIGIGAVGSIIAKTLTRCGCKFIDFIDHDIKEPENVCRSEYSFKNGIVNKTFELEKILTEISPFINCKGLQSNFFENSIKSFYNENEFKGNLERDLEYYDLIIDCSTDNDLMYVLNSLRFKNDLINISLTNHAKELVCAFYPNIYSFVNNQFSNVLNNDVEDLYEPTGCWSPTFKASYNDINTMVQIALKRLNKIFSGELSKNNFVIHEIEDQLKIIEY